MKENRNKRNMNVTVNIEETNPPQISFFLIITELTLNFRVAKFVRLIAMYKNNEDKR